MSEGLRERGLKIDEWQCLFSFLLQLIFSSSITSPSLQGGYDSGRPGDGAVADLITFEQELEGDEMRIERSMSVDSYRMDPERIERVKHPSSEQV